MARLKAITTRSYPLYLLLCVVLAATTAVSLVDIFTDAADGALFHYYFSTSVIVLSLSALSLLALTRRVVIERLRYVDRQEEERIRLLDLDPLTGALSRRAFMAELKTRTHHATTTNRCVLFLIDLDHFKTLNDSFGHNVGDVALQHLVDVARRTFRDALIGRLGGDEFAVLVHGGSAERWIGDSNAFANMLREPKSAAHRQFRLSASIGIAVAPDHTECFDELPLLADLALYTSKRSGRGCTTLFDIEMLKDQRQRRHIERDLRASILLDELDVHYQPIVRPDGAVEYVEALVRWRHPINGPIPPASFIPVAEESDLINLLGAWVLRRACRDFAALPGRAVCVNVSAVQFDRDEIVETVRDILQSFDLPPDSLIIEITEGVALSTRPGVLGRIEAIRRLGVRFALDDFGSGNSGFNYLRNLPVDILKIDRSYVARLANDPISQVFVSAVMETARHLDLTIVAEGIETDEQALIVRTAGCHLFQGYLFARPAPLNAFVPGSESNTLPKPMFAIAWRR